MTWNFSISTKFFVFQAAQHKRNLNALYHVCKFVIKLLLIFYAVKYLRNNFKFVNVLLPVKYQTHGTLFISRLTFSFFVGFIRIQRTFISSISQFLKNFTHDFVCNTPSKTCQENSPHLLTKKIVHLLQKHWFWYLYIAIPNAYVFFAIFYLAPWLILAENCAFIFHREYVKIGKIWMPKLSQHWFKDASHSNTNIQSINIDFLLLKTWKFKIKLD